MMLREPVRDIGDGPKTSKDSQRVNAEVWIGAPVEIGSASDEKSEDFTEDAFEDALDKASRLVQGKYADVMPSTEEFIHQRRKEEVEVEDREP